MERSDSSGSPVPGGAPRAARPGHLWQELLAVTTASFAFCSMLSLTIVWWLRT